MDLLDDSASFEFPLFTSVTQPRPRTRSSNLLEPLLTRSPLAPRQPTPPSDPDSSVFVLDSSCSLNLLDESMASLFLRPSTLLDDSVGAFTPDLRTVDEHEGDSRELDSLFSGGAARTVSSASILPPSLTAPSRRPSTLTCSTASSTSTARLGESTSTLGAPSPMHEDDEDDEAREQLFSSTVSYVESKTSPHKVFAARHRVVSIAAEHEGERTPVKRNPCADLFKGIIGSGSTGSGSPVNSPFQSESGSTSGTDSSGGAGAAQMAQNWRGEESATGPIQLQNPPTLLLLTSMSPPMTFEMPFVAPLLPTQTQATSLPEIDTQPSPLSRKLSTSPSKVAKVEMDLLMWDDVEMEPVMATSTLVLEPTRPSHPLRESTTDRLKKRIQEIKFKEVALLPAVSPIDLLRVSTPHALFDAALDESVIFGAGLEEDDEMDTPAMYRKVLVSSAARVSRVSAYTRSPAAVPRTVAAAAEAQTSAFLSPVARRTELGTPRAAITMAGTPGHQKESVRGRLDRAREERARRVSESPEKTFSSAIMASPSAGGATGTTRRAGERLFGSKRLSTASTSALASSKSFGRLSSLASLPSGSSSASSSSELPLPTLAIARPSATLARIQAQRLANSLASGAKAPSAPVLHASAPLARPSALLASRNSFASASTTSRLATTSRIGLARTLPSDVSSTSTLNQSSSTMPRLTSPVRTTVSGSPRLSVSMLRDGTRSRLPYSPRKSVVVSENLPIQPSSSLSGSTSGIRRPLASNSSMSALAGRRLAAATKTTGPIADGRLPTSRSGILAPRRAL